MPAYGTTQQADRKKRGEIQAYSSADLLQIIKAKRCCFCMLVNQENQWRKGKGFLHSSVTKQIKDSFPLSQESLGSQTSAYHRQSTGIVCRNVDRTADLRTRILLPKILFYLHLLDILSPKKRKRSPKNKESFQSHSQTWRWEGPSGKLKQHANLLNCRLGAAINFSLGATSCLQLVNDIFKMEYILIS